jgi:hypothetical protein
LRACHAGGGRIGEPRGNAQLGRPVGDEVLHLRQRPAMQPGADPQARFDALANVGEVSDGDGVPIDAQRDPAISFCSLCLAGGLPGGQRAHVEMHAGAAQVDCRHQLVPRDLAVRSPRSVWAGDPAQRIAARLRSEWRLGAQRPVGQLVQRVPVPAPRFDDDRSEQLAGIGRCGLPGRQRRTLDILDQDRSCSLPRRHLRGILQLGHRAHVLRALDVLAYRVWARGAPDSTAAAGFCGSLGRAFLPRPKSRVSSEGFL